MHCTQCGENNPDTARFCAACGTPLARKGSSGSLQRILTLVFIDLVGSTQAADTEDLESYDDLLKRFHEQCAALITQFDGAVVQLYGDGVLACFGLSEDGENSALAAIAACLAIVDAIPTAADGMQVRAGVHSGKVICRIQDGGQLLPQVSGLDVNVCSRVQARAEPGGVFATAATMAFLERIATVDAVDQGLTHLKGVGNPMQLFDVKGYSFEEARKESDTLLERDEIMGQLTARLSPEADADPDARVIVLMGNPGLGKSALLHELARRLSNDFMHVDLSARNNLRHTPLFPIAEWLARTLEYEHFPISADEPQDDLAIRMRRLLPDFPESELPVIADVLGLAGSAELYSRHSAGQIREMRINAIVDCLMELMARNRVLLTFDDFHWADEDSRAVMERTLERGVPQTSKIVVGSRPSVELSEYVEQNNLTLLRLQPLTEDGAKKLLDHAGLETLDDEEKRRIISMAEGNPLFLKTLLNLVSRESASGTATSLPPTIDATFQGVINSFDAAKDLVMLASVIGRTFSVRDLRYLTDDQDSFDPRFDELVRGGLVEAEQNYWQFSHILLQEAAYNMMPTSRRQQLHKQFADALAANDPARVEEYPEIVADHYLASQDTPSIATSCLQAGLKLLRRTNFERSQHYLEKAVEALQESGDDARLLSALMPLSATKVQRYGFMHPETLASYRDLELAVLDDGEHTRERILALNTVFAQRIMSGQVRAARAPLDDLRAVTHFSDDWENTMFQQASCAFQLYSGRFDEALAASQALKSRYNREKHGSIFLDTGSDPLIGVLTAEANVYALRNQIDDAIASFEDAQAQVEAIGAELQKPWVLIFTGSALVYTPGAEALAHARLVAGCDLADAQGSGFWSLNGRLWQSVVASERGEPETGSLELMGLIEQQSAVGIGLNRPLFLAIHAQDLHRSGNSDRARELIIQATRLAASYGQGQWTSEIWRKRARIQWDLNEPEQARRSWRIALAYAKRSKASVWRDRCLGDAEHVGH